MTTGSVGHEPGSARRPVPLLDTSRLRFRAPTLDDAPHIFAGYAQDPLVTRYLTWQPHDRIERTRAFLRRCLAREGLLRRWTMHPGLGPEPRDCWCFGRVR